MPFIMVTVLIDMVSIGLIVPVLPALVGSFTGSRADQTFWYGAVTFAFSFANFFGSPMLGALSDRYGRRPVLLLGFCALALSFFVTALATALWMLRRRCGCSAGAMQSNASVANAYVADITPPRAAREALRHARCDVRHRLHPRPGARRRCSARVDLRLPFFVARRARAGQPRCTAASCCPSRCRPSGAAAFAWQARESDRVAAGRCRSCAGSALLVAVVAFSGARAVRALHQLGALHAPSSSAGVRCENGWSLFAVGVTSALVQGLLLGRLLKRYSPQRLAIVGLVSSTLAYCAVRRRRPRAG